ncbi:unnamed protein product [Arabidopsis lyrata]|nr:unnamed protein product [Arabidopsis lyrata]
MPRVRLREKHWSTLCLSNASKCSWEAIEDCWGEKSFFLKEERF